jgi:hypothetical protein
MSVTATPKIDQLFKDAEAAIDEDPRFEIYNKIFTKKYRKRPCLSCSTHHIL